MKKLTSILVLIIIFSSIVWLGCGGGSDDTKEATSGPDSTPGITSAKPTVTKPPATKTTQPTSTSVETSTPTPTADTGNGQTPTPTTEVTATPTPTGVPSPTPTSTPTETPVISPTEPPTVSPTPTPTPPSSPTPTQTQDPTIGISFPDNNLEAAIRDAISKPSGSITQSDLNGLTTLVASNLSISDISGLEYCINLDDLDLSHNNISDISPLIQNSGITSGDEIDIGWNPLNDASIDYVKELADKGVEVVWGSL